MPLQVNAVITKVEARGAASGAGDDDWDRPGRDLPGDPDALKWEGSVDAYYTEKVSRAPGADVLLIRALVVDTADYDTLGLDTDDVLTFAVDGDSAQTGTAGLITVRRLAGYSRDIQTTRIELAAA